MGSGWRKEILHKMQKDFLYFLNMLRYIIKKTTSVLLDGQTPDTANLLDGGINNMSILQEGTRKLLSADFHAESTLPALAFSLGAKEKIRTQLDEDDGLFVNYGSVDSVYPYVCQDMYDRAQEPKEYITVALENENLRAVFLPEFGGKLWELIDKRTGQNLLFSNEAVRPCNLAVRNAWTSGGIEWNCGFRGHHPFTCSLVNTAKTKLDDGTPVLRFYYFERIRCAVIQMDLFLPDGSEFLFVRTRLTNPNDDMIPMYWWSNIAVRCKNGDRVIVPANQTYTTNALETAVIKIDVPVHNGRDLSYPQNTVIAHDFFWKMEPKKRPYIAQLDKNGYGLCQTSTPRLRGRKLFVWGDSCGGRKWASFLTGDGMDGAYDEIQAGLASSQYECLPMPPKTVWEWIECYGAMQADPAKIHDGWARAQQEAEQILDCRMPAVELEQWLEKTRRMAITPAELILPMNDGWGALELARREKTGWKRMNPQLDFGQIGQPQACWMRLLAEGTIGEQDPDEVPRSYMRQREWMEMLERSVAQKDWDNWFAWYLLGTAYLAEEKNEQGCAALKRSTELQDTAWAAYGLAIAYERLRDREKACVSMQKAYDMRRNDIALAREACRCLTKNGAPERAVELLAHADESIRQDARCRLICAEALFQLGRAAEADKILCGEDGKHYLVVPDIREGEVSITELWIDIHKSLGERDPQPPEELEFRKDVRHAEWG